MTLEVEVSSDIIAVPEYGAHIYVEDTDTSAINMGKEQFYVDKSGKPRLIHPHKYSEKCGDVVHIRMSPGEAPVELRILAK